MERCDILANFSEDSHAITRNYLTPEHLRVNRVLSTWMEEAGMAVHVDAVGNIIGRLEGATPGLPAVILGSHLDTVPDAGKYDGVLGVVTAISCVAELNRRRSALPFSIEVMGFGEEEGVRFQSTLIGSRAVAGALDNDILNRYDRDGVSLREALERFGLDGDRVHEAARRPEEFLAYIELHIEQGPILERRGLPLGVVSAIVGDTWLSVEIEGTAGHAGTVPMALRKDALAAAAECIVSVERICRERELVGTVGRLELSPGAINVIPGRAAFTVDIRSESDVRRQNAVNEILEGMKAICEQRGVTLHLKKAHESPSCICSSELSQQLADSVRAEGLAPMFLQSAAGHNAMAMARLAEVSMLFVRCERGISHNPKETVRLGDAEVSARVLLRFLEDFKVEPST
jgi:allantoate deiminase